ncbi:MAG: hypothetical protein ACT4O2_12525 [Beijerinckiaceae bacterium]
MRSILTVVFVAALAAVPAQSKAAPRSIDDCEKIQAADAYNQCLAIFGPVARGHGRTLASAEVKGQDAEAVTANARAEVAVEGGSHYRHRHASRHRWTRHTRQGHWHRTGAAGHRNGKGATMAFREVLGRVRR